MSLIDHIVSVNRNEWAHLHAYGVVLRARVQLGSQDLYMEDQCGFKGDAPAWSVTTSVAIPYLNDPNWTLKEGTKVAD